MNKNKYVPKIMGILNVTPDSFYKESRSNNKNLNKIDYGLANILDIGFESSRPGSIPLSKLKEINRLSKFLSKYQDFHRNLSIDTYKHEVADFALKNGFKIINDIRGGGEKGQMFEVALKHNAQIVIMHMKGDPLNMQKQPFYKDVINELLNFFDKKINLAKTIGLRDDQIIIDPGLGFGKRIEDNDVIINNLEKLKSFGYPLMVGLSRKSFLSNNNFPKDRLPATLGATVIAINNGADIIRTHDINDTFNMISTINRIYNSVYK